ncbi:hypothetical protein IEQ34_021058 [Dendrobium chrysotoxum]|uniref:Cytokinin riboside 5'-monophosphate phosphoribohydrolase n=1 Tax=Dendrobium chrysotoxum TaxID=161865 RepID=A0AAV7G2J5_DENCH|nr:hypothetical protein IEQ34_021058 [Dendrobium chrysotoxum]
MCAGDATSRQRACRVLRGNALIAISPPLSSWFPTTHICLAFLLPYFMEKPQNQDNNSSEQKNEESGLKKRNFRRICVFCGSSSGNRPSFSAATLELGKQLIDRKIDLIYGGGSVGLMGLISHTFFLEKSIIPRALLQYEISGETIGEVKTVSDMHERKSEMAKHADAFIALPEFDSKYKGGYGTMEELLEIIAWSQLGIHEKPVGLLNVDGYYNSLLALFDKGVEEGFIENSAKHIVVSADNAEELMRKLEIASILNAHKVNKEYKPLHEIVAPRTSWEVDQLLEPSSL